ncbi:DUF3375 domain-containing protein [Parashewanella spongiae]|uniref:DUF3375 domain-containing protein n=1 Tax=Parashewanella spongiae TaxID=342950 RepID=A0A3A6TKF1_9GAMM|nr:DUF3375 domain-containing protein [Parashewanella spongiae]MCL1078751.1 DUF3375 domain-containing protein [Parashewanella spongiae]RJY12505.1 DUF3375 domain-containing protein [Parashewanella spongiae]
MPLSFNYGFIEELKSHSMALKLLRSPHLSFIASFLHQVFILSNRRTIAYTELVGLLENHIQEIRDTHGEALFPKSAKSYLDDWINTQTGYLRKYLPKETDEPECDLQPDIEKVLRWLEDLQGRRFVGTESRLQNLLQLITELSQGINLNTQEKLTYLKRKQAQIQNDIEAVENGQDINLSDTQVKERLFFLSDLSRQLLGDFRQVEANFRTLDKQTRKTITLSQAQKGQVLDQVFEYQDVIENSDEGQSFSTFFELLMTPEMRDGMRKNLQALLKHKEAQEIVASDTLLRHLYSYLLDAGRKVNTTRQQVTDQLRRYVQEQSQDNRRILELIRDYEKTLHTSIEKMPITTEAITELDSASIEISSLFSRKLYQEPQQEQFSIQPEQQIDPHSADLSQLFALSHIDEDQLVQHIQHQLTHEKGQTNLQKIINTYPLEFGLDELLTYVKLACEGPISANIDFDNLQKIEWHIDGAPRSATLPTIRFFRETN